MTKNVNLHHITVFTSFRSQESKVLSIIRHRGAPRRSLGNYKKISLPSYLRGAPLCLIIDRTSDSCVPMVLRKHALYNIRYLSFEWICIYTGMTIKVIKFKSWTSIIFNCILTIIALKFGYNCLQYLKRVSYIKDVLYITFLECKSVTWQMNGD